jgi:hypothetical protein
MRFTGNDTITFDTGGTSRVQITDATTEIGNDLSLADTIVHTGDTNTKIRFPAADTVTAETGGVERLRINSTGQTIVGDSVAQLSTSSERPFQVHSVDGPKIAIGRNDTSISAGNTIGGLEFYGNDANGTFVNTASIIVNADGTHGDNDKPTRMQFFTTADNGSSASERMRIDSSGRVLIGITSTSQDHGLLVQASSNANAIGILGRASDDIGELSFFQNDGSSKLGELQYRVGELSLRHREGGANILFANTPVGGSVTERMRITHDGKVAIGLTSPDQLLHIYQQSGSSQAYIHVQNNRSRNAAIQFTTTQGSWLVGQGIGNDNDRFAIYDTAERFVINSSGQVGIGMDPVRNHKLCLQLAASSIATTSTASVLLVENNTNCFITIGSGASSLGGVLFGDSGAAGQGQVRYDHSGDFLQILANEENLAKFILNGAVELYFDNSKKLESTSAGVTVTGTVTETSDKAFKSNIQPLTNTLEKIKQITGYKYNLNSQPSMGVIAQDVEKVFPELVHGFEGQKSLQYSGLIGVLVEAVKDLSTKVAALEAA